MRDGRTLYDYDLHEVAANPTDLHTADSRSNSAYRFFDRQCENCRWRAERGDPAELDGPCYDMVVFTRDGEIKREMHRGGRNPLTCKRQTPRAA